MIGYRRAVSLATLLLAGLAVSPAAVARTAPPATVKQVDRLAALTRDIDRVESVREIKRIQVAWASDVDLGNWERAAALFTDDALLAHGERQFAGRQEILAYMRESIGGGRDGLSANTIHTPLLMAPIVILSADGKTATGRWRVISMRGALGGEANWGGGIFDNDYVRVGGAWKISRQIFHPYMAGSYEAGWHSATDALPMIPYRYQPGDIGRPAALGSTIAAAIPGARLPTLVGRARALGDEAAIRNLQDAYGYYVDRKMWDDVVDLFVADGRFVIVGGGSYRGRGGIRQSLEQNGAAGLLYGEMNDHLQANVIVEVAPDGVRARAHGVELGMIGQNEGDAYWTLSRFDNQFVKQGGKWRIANMQIAPWMKTDYRLGWNNSWIGPSVLPSAVPPPRPLERTAPAQPAVNARLPDVEAATRAAAAYDAIENLAGAYGQYLDDSHWEELGQLFAAQGERDSAGGGFIRTPARIASFSRQRYGGYNPKRTGANMHIRTQPVINIAADGTRAQMRTRLLQFVVAPATSAGPFREPMIATGMYEDDIVFEDGAWRFKRVDIDHLLYTNGYKNGWTRIKEGQLAKMTPSLANVAGLKFDAPGAGDNHPSFPRVGHMWFHYRNPVSGRAPPYLMPKYSLPEP